MSKTKRIIVAAAAAVLICIAVAAGGYLGKVNNYKNNVKNMNISNINFSNLKDGTYKGECNVDFIRAAVEVTVKNNKITDIVLVEHYNERGKAAEKISKNIIEKQTLQVDNIAGATNSSKVTKKAVENALANAQ